MLLSEVYLQNGCFVLQLRNAFTCKSPIRADIVFLKDDISMSHEKVTKPKYKSLYKYEVICSSSIKCNSKTVFL